MSKPQVKELVMTSAHGARVEFCELQSQLYIEIDNGEDTRIALLDREQARKVRDWIEHEYLDKV